MALSHAQQGVHVSPFRKKSTLFYILLVLPIVGILLFVTLQPVLVLPRMRLSPGYLLINQDGEQVSHENLRGHIVIYHVAYTGCGDACAQSWSLMMALQRELARLQSEFPIDLVTISIDPAQDTPETLRRFVASQQIDSDRWHLLTGDPEQLKYVVGGGFNTYYTTDENGVLKLEPSLSIVDGLGILRAAYRADLPSVETLLRDIDLLLDEARNSEGLARYAYEAAHLFLCYP